MKKYMTKKHMKTFLMFSLIVFTVVCPDVVFASQQAQNQVVGKFETFSTLFTDIISVLGQIYTLWGVSEWGLAWHESNGTMGSQSFKRIFGGLVVVLSPQILSIIA